MIREAVAFLSIVAAYMLLITTIFATLFRNVDSVDNFSSLPNTFRTLFDFTVGNISDLEMGNYQTSFTILYIIHIIISNIFLINFLVAIIASVYDSMFKNGDFYSVQFQYQFINKYKKAIEENNGYDELILYPPPLNYVIVPLLLVCASKESMKKYAAVFS